MAWTHAVKPTTARTASFEIGTRGLSPYLPDPAAAKHEQRGTANALEIHGGELAWIKPKRPLPIPPLEKWMGDLLQRIWVKGQASGPRPTHGRHLGGHRPNRPEPPARPTTHLVSSIHDNEWTGLHLSGVANDWGDIKKFERVNAYTFRGDSRGMDDVAACGGFGVSSARNDERFLKGSVYDKFEDYCRRRGIPFHLTRDQFFATVKETLATTAQRDILIDYMVWREMVKTEEKHLGRMMANEVLRSYISTSRCVEVAKGFAVMGSPPHAGWVYAVFVRGGFLIRQPGQPGGHHWAVFYEDEIANPGSIAWTDVVGARKVTDQAMFDSSCPVYLRPGFVQTEPEAAAKVHAALSGNPWRTAAQPPLPPKPAHMKA